MILRLIKPEDSSNIVRMGEHFYKAAKLFGGFSPSNFLQFWHHAIMEGQGFIIVAEIEGQAVGALGALIFDCPHDADTKVSQELFWWMEPEHRGEDSARLITAFEELSQQMGASVLTMSAIHGMRERAVGRLYSRIGYRPQEISYIKEV